MGLLDHNPFRVLGLSITASSREIEKQLNKLETYAEMGKTVSFETDFAFLSPIVRSLDVIDEARRQIHIDEQKFFHSLFWFWKNNSVDALALELLSDGKVEKAVDIWEKAVFANAEKGCAIVVTNKNFSCLKNLSTLFLSRASDHGVLKSHILDKILVPIERVFLSDQISTYAKLIAGDRFIYDREKALEFYVRSLANGLESSLDKTYGVTTGEFVKAFSIFPSKTSQLVRDIFGASPIQRINNALAVAKDQRNTDSRVAVDAGSVLLDKVDSNISYLRKTLGDDSFEYQTLADKVANELVQCAIDYFNATRDDEPGLPLYKYADQIATSIKVKERAAENLASCERWIKVSVPLEKIHRIAEASQERRASSPKDAIDIGKQLIADSSEGMAAIIEIVGENDPEYKIAADRLAYEIVQCGIDHFNATKNDERGLPLYQYAVAIAASKEAEKHATENLNSCKKWIENKVYLFCFFCGNNEPDSHWNVYKTIYQETSRSYFPRRSVAFSYVDVTIPRCGDCASVHEQVSSYSRKYYGLILAGLVIGFIVGAVSAPAAYTSGAGIAVAIVAGFVGWIVANRFLTPVDLDGIKTVGMAGQYPPVKQRISEGWTFSKPSA